MNYGPKAYALAKEAEKKRAWMENGTRVNKGAERPKLSSTPSETKTPAAPKGAKTSTHNTKISKSNRLRDFISQGKDVIKNNPKTAIGAGLGLAGLGGTAAYASSGRSDREK